MTKSTYLDCPTYVRENRYVDSNVSEYELIHFFFKTYLDMMNFHIASNSYGVSESQTHYLNLLLNFTLAFRETPIFS